MYSPVQLNKNGYLFANEPFSNRLSGLETACQVFGRTLGWLHHIFLSTKWRQLDSADECGGGGGERKECEGQLTKIC